MIRKVSAVVLEFGDAKATFLHASVSFPSHGMLSVLCELFDIRQISCSGMLSGIARPPRTLLRLDLPEGRLRLDRLGRNGCASTFFP